MYCPRFHRNPSAKDGSRSTDDRQRLTYTAWGRPGWAWMNRTGTGRIPWRRSWSETHFQVEEMEGQNTNSKECPRDPVGDQERWRNVWLIDRKMRDNGQSIFFRVSAGPLFIWSAVPKEKKQAWCKKWICLASFTCKTQEKRTLHSHQLLWHSLIQASHSVLDQCIMWYCKALYPIH